MSLDGQRPSTCTPGVVDLVPPTDTSRQRERNHPSMGAGSTLSFEREVSRQTRVLFPPRGAWIQSRRRRRSVGGQCQRAFIWGGTLTNRLGDIRRGGTRMRGGDKFSIAVGLPRNRAKPTSSTGAGRLASRTRGGKVKVGGRPTDHGSRHLSRVSRGYFLVAKWLSGMVFLTTGAARMWLVEEVDVSIIAASP